MTMLKTGFASPPLMLGRRRSSDSQRRRENYPARRSRW